MHQQVCLRKYSSVREYVLEERNKAWCDGCSEFLAVTLVQLETNETSETAFFSSPMEHFGKEYSKKTSEIFPFPCSVPFSLHTQSDMDM